MKRTLTTRATLGGTATAMRQIMRDAESARLRAQRDKLAATLQRIEERAQELSDRGRDVKTVELAAIAEQARAALARIQADA